MLCRLEVMDCMDALRAFAPQADLIFTSPPYNVGKDYDSSDDLLFAHDYRRFMHEFFSLAFEYSRPGTRLVLNLPMLFKDRLGETYPVSQTLMPLAYTPPAEWKWHAEIVWSKYGKDGEQSAPGTAWGSFCSASAPAIRIHTERIYVLYKETWRRQLPRPDLCGEIIDRTDFARCTRDIWVVPGISHRNHPAVMAPEIARRIVTLFSFPGDTVFDPFCGIGTVPLVSALHERESIGTDLSPQYIAQAYSEASANLIDTV